MQRYYFFFMYAIVFAFFCIFFAFFYNHLEITHARSSPDPRQIHRRSTPDPSQIRARSDPTMRDEIPCGAPSLRSPHRRAERSHSGKTRRPSSGLRLSPLSSRAWRRLVPRFCPPLSRLLGHAPPARFCPRLRGCVGAFLLVFPYAFGRCRSSRPAVAGLAR